MTVRETTCASAFRAVRGRFPYRWDLNPYRGCGHRCQYCFALYSHRYLESEAFYDEIYVKTNIAGQLERQLSRPDWPREVINIGGVTDSYQPLEARYRLMPDILRLFIKYRTPCIISTKSDLILRDFDLLDELSRLTFVNIASTITTVDETVRTRLEPGGVSSARRFAMLREFSRTPAVTGVHIMPIIPYLTDGRDALSALLQQAAAVRAGYVLPGTLYLRGPTRECFFRFIQRDYPQLYQPLRELFTHRGAREAYKHALFPMVRELIRDNGLRTDYGSLMRARLPQPPEQLTLF